MNLLFFDIDGTVIDESGCIPVSTVRSISALQKKGDLCFVNTGRPFSHIDQRVKALGFGGYVCSCGQHIEYQGKVLLHAGFSREESRVIADTIRACHLSALYEAEAGIWVDFRGAVPPIVENDRKRFESSGLKTAGSVEDDDFRFDKFCVFRNPGCDFRPLTDLIKDTCTMIDRGHSGFYECILRDFSKATGIEFVRSMFDVPLANCYAFGDSTNDLPMLEAVPHSVAMGGSPATVRKACEFVTSDLMEDGISRALEHYGLLSGNSAAPF